MNRDDGFTLMEVLAALLILSVGILALIRTTSGAVRVASRVELGTLAGTVADNQLAIARTAEARRVGASPPPTRGETEQMGFTFEWNVERRDTAVDDLRELVVDVSLDGQVLVTRRGFVAEQRPALTQ